jgi:hypothetical protein
VMASAVDMLDVGGFGPENHTLGGLKAPNSAVRCPIVANEDAKGSLSPK